MSEAILQQILSRLGAIEKKLGVAAASSDDGPSRSPLAVDFEACIIGGPAKALFAAAEGIPGDDGAKIAGAFRAQFAFALKVLDMTAGCKKPAPEELPPLYAELKAASKPFGDLQAPKGGTKDGDVCNAVRGFEQGASAFSWPLAATGGVDTVAQGLDSSGLYVMRASKAAKEAGEAKKALLGTCLAYNAAVKAMQEWVKENAKMGLVWNAKGAAVKDWAGVAAGGSGGGGGGGGGAAAAPAPAAAPAAAPAPAAPTPAGGADAPATPNLGALFSSIASIDQSSGRTAGLRKVTKEMKSGGALGPGSAAAGGGGTPTPTPTPPATTPRPAAGGVKMGAPKLAEEGMRWVCEFHTKDTQQGAILTIGGASIKQEVYIYGCRDVVIDITTKVKGVRLDSCHNVQLLVQGALSGMEVVNSKRMKLQVKDRLPSVAIDKTDGIVVGLPWTSRDAIITSSKSSEMNVTFPLSDAADADWVEKAIPEQYVSKITKDNKVESSVSDLYSH